MKLSYISAILLLAAVTGCAGTEEVKPLPDYVAVSPVRTLAEIQHSFRENQPGFTSLIERAHSASGRIVVGLTVQPDGTVSECHIAETTFGGPLNELILAKVKAMTFGARNVPAYVVADYPITYIR